MFEFYLGDHKHSMKTEWHELSADEFVKVSQLISCFRKGEYSLFDIRVRLVLLLCGIDISRMRIKGNEDRLNENIYQLTRELDFFFRIEYENEKAFAQFSPEMRRQLSRKFPEDLPESPETRVASKLKKHIRINIEFPANLIPDIRFGRQRFPGYTFIVVDGIAQTSLTALQFAEAQKISSQYWQNESGQLLNMLCGILYQCGYSEPTAMELSERMQPVPRHIKEAILLNFSAITNFIVHSTKYSILFERPRKSKKNGKYSLGLVENMYSLSKRGYGDSHLMENANLFKFFDLVIKEMADQVDELHRAGKNKGEISEIMNLSIEQLNDLTS